MSQENVEIVEASYEAFARGALDRYMEHFTDDVEYRRQGPLAPASDEHRERATRLSLGRADRVS